MNNKNTVRLHVCANYSNTRVSCTNLTPENYVSTDNLLQNKLGKVTALYTPTTGATTGYSKGDILIANIRPYLKKIWYATNEGGSSADVLTLKVKSKYNSKYIYYALFRDDFFAHVMKGSKGSKMPRGDKKQILDFLIPNFDLSTQQKIAIVLSVLDSKIELNNRINAELEQVAKTLYDYWFMQFDFPDKNGKPYKSSGGKMEWNKELKRKIPSEWEVKSLGVLLNKSSDTSEKIMSYDIKNNGKYPVITQDTGSLVAGYTDKEGPITRVPLIVFGDHSCTLRYINFPFFRGADGTQLLTFDSSIILYIYQFLESVIRQIPNYGKYERHFKYVKELVLVVPPKQLLNKFNAAISPSLDISRILREENRKLSNLRDWLLPMLMNGQVKINN